MVGWRGYGRAGGAGADGGQGPEAAEVVAAGGVAGLLPHGGTGLLTPWAELAVGPVGFPARSGPSPAGLVPYQEDLTMPGSWPCSAIWRKRTREVPVTRR